MWWEELSVRVVNCLYNAGLESREAVLEAYKSGRLRPKSPRNYGWKSHQEVARWLGMPEPTKRKPKICPHCGGMF